MISVLGVIHVVFIKQLDKETRMWFFAIFVTLAAYNGSVFIGECWDTGVGRIWQIISMIFIFLESAFAGLLMVIIIGFLLYSAKEKELLKNRLFMISYILFGVYLGILIYTQFSTSIYYVDLQNVYHRGPFYPIILIPPIFLMVWNLVILFIKRNKLKRNEIITFAVCMIFPIIGMVLQMMFYGILLILLFTNIANVYLYIEILRNQMEEYYKRETENALLKIDILLAQIQPHFLYNTLTTIKYICRKDPQKAEEAIEKFTVYLRHNMDSLNMERPISFMEEIKHVKAYVELQQLRFEEDLNVEYNLECTDFKIPTLTLQPLVENAITYGIRKNEQGSGIIKVSSKEYEDSIVISVTDNGRGFDPSKIHDGEDRSHIGIKNVKERIKLVVGGELEVESEIGKGTAVKITLPKSC
jgi:signal transduction histidine kinase